ncbi:insulinase family protein [Phragmitibacter flavus]|uniref:Insulinase family protein n=1 Tax=Phragmitibacter flavus TaxID=2576071 RepID=A0A5R8KBB7_9BACT|nr:pitrilysin family protein [Phragmitibacter flavus]TLD69608.1 insulinase family protein [Phragmitibacter flavus]
MNQLHSTSPAAPDQLSLPPNAAQFHTLNNGLEVILLEDHAHPLASVQFWVKAGSLHEEKWTGAGLAHLVEHMFFKGTTTRTASQISQEIQARGGYVNAYTTFERTVYWIEGVAEQVDGYLGILSDMARNSNFDAGELVKEQEVIRREFAMDNDDPQSALQHLLQQTAFREHPLRHPIIGHLEVFNQVGREDVVHFVNRHYVPNNCFLVITGAIDSATIMESVEKHYGTWQRRPYEPVMMPDEPDQVATRQAKREFATDIARLSLGWQVPGDSHPDKPALDVLGFILGSGRSSRLNLLLREELGIAHWVGAGAWSALDRGLFAVEAECDPEDLAQVEEAISKIIQTAREEGCKPDELDKAVRTTLSHQLRTRSTTRGMASSLAHSWMSVGNLNHDRAYLERISTLTVADIVQVARKYLVPETLSRVSIHPTGTLEKTTGIATTHTREEIQSFTLSNGLTLLVGENPRLPLVSVRTQFLSGVPSETSETGGVTQITAQLLAKGAGKRSAEQIGALLEDRGGSLQSSADVHRLFVGSDVMKGDEELAMGLIADLLTVPTFPVKSLATLKKRQIASIREEMEDPLTVALRRARKEIFAGLSYERTAMGTIESVQALDVDACKTHFQQTVQGKNGVISVFGDVKAEEVREQVARLFSPIPPGTSHRDQYAPLTPTAEPSRHELTLDKEQGVLVVGFPTVGLEHDLAPVLHLIDEACSDMGSRLFNRIREEMGLAYYVGTQAFHALGAGAFYFYVGTDPAKLDLVETELLKEVADLAANGLQPDEMERAKTTWKSSYLRGQQGNGALADAFGWQQLNGRGYQHQLIQPEIISSITPEQVKAAAAIFFSTKPFVVRVKP